MIRPPPRSPLFPYTPLFRSGQTHVMIVLLLVALATPPQAVVIATPRGQTSVPVRTERGQAAVAASRLAAPLELTMALEDRKSTRLNSSHSQISHAVFCLQKK